MTKKQDQIANAGRLTRPDLKKKPQTPDAERIDDQGPGRDDRSPIDIDIEQARTPRRQ